MSAYAQSPKPSDPIDSLAPTVKLLKQGSKPHTVLQYRLKPKMRIFMNMTMQMGMQMTMYMPDGKPYSPDVQMPPTLITFALECQKVAANGNATIRGILIEAKPLQAPNVMPMVQKSLEEELKKIRGMSKSYTLSPSGMILSVNFYMPPSASQQYQQIMSNIEQSIRQLATPLPSQPVGIGAQWQVINHLTKPMNITQVATYTLLKRQGQNITIGMALTQRAKNQTIYSQTAHGKIKNTIENMDATGGGTSTIQLNGLQVNGQIASQSNMKMTVHVGDQSQKMDMRMSIKTLIQSRKAPLSSPDAE
jgi:hypothetical protein